MIHNKFTRITSHFTRNIAFVIASLMLVAYIAPAFASFNANANTLAVQQPNINYGGFYSSDRVRRGTSVQAAVVLDIPKGVHVNANRPLGKYAVPTIVRVEAADGVRVSPVTYPRSIARNFKFSDERLAVYEGRAVMRFNVSVPANFRGDRANVRARVRFQSCNDEVCFPPVTRDIDMAIGVANANEKVNPTATALFGKRR